MTKQIFEKIFKGGVLKKHDLTADEKKRLYALMNEKGLSSSAAYLRFFDKGFDPWEIEGITITRNRFLISTAPPDSMTGDCGYLYVLTLADDYDDSKFYSLITEQKVGKNFCDYMADLGMKSQATVRNRFKANDWKQWELDGIRNIIKEFINQA